MEDKTFDPIEFLNECIKGIDDYLKIIKNTDPTIFGEKTIELTTRKDNFKKVIELLK